MYDDEGLPRWRRFLRHPPRPMGRRGAILLSLGIIWCLFGLGSYRTPRYETPTVLYEYIPPEIRLALWVGTAVIAFLHVLTPPARFDGVGFAALTIMPAERAAAWAYEWIVGLIPGGEIGEPRAGEQLLLYLMVLNIVLICSGWRENTPVRAVGGGGSATPPPGVPTDRRQ